MDPKTFSAGTVEKIGNVMKIVYTKDSEITFEDMQEVTAIREALFGMEQYVSLIDIRHENLTISKEAKRYVTENKIIKKLRVAEVLLVKSFTQKLFVHSYVTFFRSGDNISVMTDEENALHWLNSQYDKHAVEFVE